MKEVKTREKTDQKERRSKTREGVEKCRHVWYDQNQKTANCNSAKYNIKMRKCEKMYLLLKYIQKCVQVGRL